MSSQLLKNGLECMTTNVRTQSDLRNVRENGIEVKTVPYRRRSRKSFRRDILETAQTGFVIRAGQM